MQLLTIADRDENQEIVNIDFTQFVQVPSWKVSEFDITQDWEDGNLKTHQYILRTQITGTFTLKFYKTADFHRFFETLNRNKITTGENSGAVLATVYLLNKNIVKSAYLRFSTDPQDTLPLLGSGSYEGFEVSVKEV